MRHENNFWDTEPKIFNIFAELLKKRSLTNPYFYLRKKENHLHSSFKVLKWKTDNALPRLCEARNNPGFEMDNG